MLARGGTQIDAPSRSIRSSTARGIELEAQLTAKYGIIGKAPAYDDLVRSPSS